MVEKSNRVWPEIGALERDICPTGYSWGQMASLLESSLPTCMIGRLDHMSAAVSTSPLATCFGCFAGPLFPLSGLSASSPLPCPLLSISQPQRSSQKPELVFCLQPSKASLFRNLILALRLSMTWPTHLTSSHSLPCPPNSNYSNLISTSGPLYLLVLSGTLYP